MTKPPEARMPFKTLSLDIETTGPLPGIHDIVQIGWTIRNPNGSTKLNVESNIIYQRPLTWDADTAQWWNESAQSRAKREAFSQHGLQLEEALKCLMKDLDDNTRILCAPVVYDGMWIQYLLQRMGLVSKPIKMLDLRSFCDGLKFAGLIDQPTIDEIIKFHQIQNPLEHTALNDAIEQANTFFQILKETCK